MTDYQKGFCDGYDKAIEHGKELFPLVIEAYQTDKEIEIKTLHGTMKADVGDWIITGVKGEQYLCKPDIFEATYDLVE